jgi:hypothetical protein
MAALETLGVDKLVHTPILLFMVALTWTQYTQRTEPLPRAALYESFFQQIATGKAKVDKEHHNPIAAASAAVLAALTERSVLEQGAGRSDAMLWLMGRVAWEAQMLEQCDRPRPLTTGDVATMLRTELELERDACHAIEVGLLLALQSDLRAADHQILFGHQSFREFLVARHWGMQLYRLVRGSQREWDSRTHELLGGRLLGTENKALDFLMQIINAESVPQTPAALLAWTDPDREMLVKWAQETFADETPVFERRERGRHRSKVHLRDDLQAVMREAALAIGSLIDDTPGMRAPDRLTLRSMLAWFWLSGRVAIVIARKSKLDGAHLGGAHLEGAHLDEAHLDEADLGDANLIGAHLRGAYLIRAYLIRAYLIRANLVGAHLEGANLVGVYLQGAYLQRANLEEANLQGADLEGADLEGADLEGADLEGAHLEGAHLEGARLEETQLNSVSHDEATIWPDGLDPRDIGGL